VRGSGGTITLADVRVGTSAVLLPGSALDARQSRRLVELGLRPGATVRVMMRTSGGGRVLGVDNLRIVVDRTTLGSIPVTLPATSPAVSPAVDTSPETDHHPALDAAPADGPRAGPVLADRLDGERPPRGQRSGSRLGSATRRLRLLGRAPGLTVLPGEPLGDGTD
jgi:ferrous iron transport protein A